MKSLRMTVLSRSLALFALFAAAADTQPLVAQTTLRDSAIAKGGSIRARLDSTGVLSTTPLVNYCRQYSTIGWFKNGSCIWQVPLLTRAGSDLSALLGMVPRMTKPDTVIKTVTKTDTLRLTKTDTVFVQQPPPPATVATVSTSLSASTLAPGQTTKARAIVKDSAGITLSRAVTWTSTNQSIAAVSDSGLVTAISPGTSAIRATIDTKTSYATLTVIAPVDTTPTPPPPPLDSSSIVKPPTLLNTALSATPATGRTINATDLQAALDTVLDGDRLVIPCVAKPVGNFVLRPRRAGGKTGEWVWVMTGCTMPAEGTRTSPTQSFATISSPNILPAISTEGAAQRWRFIGVEVTTTAATNQGLIALGCPNQCETTLASQPRDIIFDRSYIHVPAETDVRRCLGFNGVRLSVIESYVSDCHSTFDAQAISGHNGPGPFKIVNNYLEASTENIVFGGGDPVAGVGLVPSDIEIRRNHITRPMSWKGSRWLIKNLIELKQGRRVLIEGNVLENSWASAQDFAFVLWSVNQQTTCTWCEVGHVLIQNNVIRHVAAGFSLNATGSNDLPQYRAVAMHHVTIRNNVLIGVDNPDIGGNGRLFQINNPIEHLTIEHNTAFSPTNASFIWGSTLPLPYHIVRNNLVGGGQYQLFTVYGQGQIAWDHAGGVGSVFDRNAIAAFSGGNMVAGNWADSFAAFGIAKPYDVTATLDDFVLPATSILKGKATDGKDVGVDIAAVKAATANVVQATSTAGLRIQKP